MKQGVSVWTRAVCVCLALFLFSLGILAAETGAKGNIVGFVYGLDGSSPMEGAVVKFKNLTSGDVFFSTASDSYGIFKVEGVDSGMYTYGVVTDRGDFNADGMIGLKVDSGETAKLSIALSAYEKEEASAVKEVMKDQEINGESLIGMIAAFDPSTKTAVVQVTRGLLRSQDKIHAKGGATDFYQEVGDLKIGTSPAERVLAGQAGMLKLEKDAQHGDLVYVVKNKKFSPLFLAPLGIAAVVAGNAAVSYSFYRIKDRSQPASPDRNN
jgi:hypothetical protein